MTEIIPIEKTIGIISDTHGRLPVSVFTIFKGVDLIIHAGDVGLSEILIELETIAPVYAVYGNVDGWDLRSQLKAVRQIHMNGYTLVVSHVPVKPDKIDYKQGLIKIYGHTHYPEIRHNGKEMVINPGSASEPRNKKKPSVVTLQIRDGLPPKADIIYF